MPPDQDALEFELAFAHGVRLDVLTTRDAAGQGAIARFLARFGAGIQQVECDVRDVTRATEMLRARFAIEPIYPETRAGADGTRVNFFLVPADEGRKILIELVEVPSETKEPDRRKKTVEVERTQSERCDGAAGVCWALPPARLPGTRARRARSRRRSRPARWRRAARAADRRRRFRATVPGAVAVR